MYLLDVNVLIALCDPNHVHHARGRGWFLSSDCDAWATCPITENGLIRILGQPGYPDFAGGPDDARQVLHALTRAPGHQFWPDAVTLRDEAAFTGLRSSTLVTDLYLLGLAVHYRGRFATLDARIDPSMVSGGAGALFPIP